MSRIGKLPVNLPAGVTLKVEAGNVVKVKGPLGELSQKVDADIRVAVEGNVVKVTRPTDQPRHRSMHGLYRALIQNMVTGVSTGYTIKQEFVGVGYRVEVKGQVLEMSIGYSHDVHLMLPNEVKAVAEQVKKGQAPILALTSHDKQLLGMVAAKLRSLRKPEPYKGKGIKFVGEQLRRKAGKSASAK
ncbi:MAG: 50S ribosomal protein L6 [Bacteroidales bacterium]|jgi:large subunit ribosomal protein L6|nr:50S ribosomal protein L6 [Bacteroidales bacterium]MDD3300002.1 50S ribosomal protein L6 [Bacteroidales bacterium]MDD3844161.1 50S ribosomal protein L6 [Bacteroidales bacterium]MDD4618573.1 50S ribosomal protein L6 [Bacteroidales bacterium]